jgi:hypothetical protein
MVGTPIDLTGVTHPWARDHGRPKRLIERAAPIMPALPTTDFTFATAMYESGDWESASVLPSNLIDSIAKYTVLPVAPKGVYVGLGTGDVFQFPFVWFTGHLPVRLTDAERRNLKKYVDRGGFIVVDDHNHDVDGVYHKTVTQEIGRTFGPTALKKIPNDHELYRNFFKFDDGPPATTHELNGWGDNLMHRYLQGIERDGRIGLLYSNKDYSSEWNFHPETKRFIAIDPTRFGINLVVYALTR